MTSSLDDIVARLNGKRKKFLEAALRYEGHHSTPFLGKYVPVGPGGDMSCSGFICWIADELGVRRPESKFTEKPVRTSRQIFYEWGSPVTRDTAEAGDLVFFSKRGTQVVHVGIYLGSGKYLHSPGTSGGIIRVSGIESFKPTRFSEGRHGLYDVVFAQNPVGFNRIFQ